jgi:hypothetical protein
MSGKLAKKIRQIYKRDVRGIVKEATANLNEDLMGKNPPLKAKPKYCPKWLWKWVVFKVINKDFFEKYYGEIK